MFFYCSSFEFVGEVPTSGFTCSSISGRISGSGFISEVSGNICFSFTDSSRNLFFLCRRIVSLFCAITLRTITTGIKTANNIVGFDREIKAEQERQKEQEIKAAEIEKRKTKKRQEKAQKEEEKRRKEEEKNKNQILKM